MPGKFPEGLISAAARYGGAVSIFGLSGTLLAMKLIRFVLRRDPEQVRSGIVQGGRIYETEDGQGVAQHEANEIRPLIPIAGHRCIRFFHQQLQPRFDSPLDIDEPSFFFGNPSALFGPSTIVSIPPMIAGVMPVPYIVAITLSDAFRIQPEDAETVILGYTLGLALVDAVQWQTDRQQGLGFGSSIDLGVAIGPAITTPDELEDFMEDRDRSRSLGLDAILRVNGVDRARGSSADLSVNFAEALAAASVRSPIREGDLFALGPVTADTDDIRLEPGDEVQLAVENLGAISVKLAD